MYTRYSVHRAVHAENVPPVRFCATDGDAQKPNIAHASSAVMYYSHQEPRRVPHLISFHLSLPTIAAKQGPF